MSLKIKAYYVKKSDGIDNLKVETEENYTDRPAWIHIKNENFNARFLDIETSKNSGSLYKRFTGNFYYPIDMTKDEELRFYGKYAQYYDEFTLRNNLPMAELLLNKLKELEVPRTAKILDLGAGTGIFSNIAVDAGFTEITLLDISKHMLDVAHTKENLDDKKYIVGDIVNTDIPESFDAIVSVMMFDAIDDDKLDSVLNKLQGNLNDRGYILLIEDKDRPYFEKHFETLEKGIFEVSKEKKFDKWYFIGRKRK